MVLIISMSAMGIGMITLSLSKPKDKKKEATPVTVTTDVTETQNPTEQTAANVIELIGQPADGELRMDAYPAISELVQKYMTAKVNCDYETIRTLVSDATVINEDDLRAKSEYIEDYKNIACYTLNGLTADSFVVYVYEDLKILNVNTLAPGMTRLYIKLDESGNPYIYLGAVDDDTQKFIEDTATNQAVIDLINTVNTKLDEAVTKDAELKKFIEDRSNADAATDDAKADNTKSEDKKKEETDSKDTSSDKKSTDKEEKDSSNNN